MRFLIPSTYLSLLLSLSNYFEPLPWLPVSPSFSPLLVSNPSILLKFETLCYMNHHLPMYLFTHYLVFFSSDFYPNLDSGFASVLIIDWIGDLDFNYIICKRMMGLIFLIACMIIAVLLFPSKLYFHGGKSLELVSWELLNWIW